MNSKNLKDKIESLEIQLEHLRNDYLLTREEYESSTRKYLDILFELKEKNKELEDLKKNLEIKVEERTEELANSEQTLQLKSEELQNMLDASPAMIYYKDKKGKYVRVNRSYSEALGMDIKKLVGKSHFEVFPEEAKRLEEEDKEIIKTGKAQFGILELVNTSKGKKWFLTDKIPYKDIKNKIIGVIGFSLDVTKQKKAEELQHESEEKYRTLVENINIGIFRLKGKDSGEFLQANSAMMKIFGYDSIDKFLKTNFSDFFEDPSSWKLYIYELQKEGFVGNKEVNLKKEDGTVIVGFISSRAQIEANGEILWIDGALEDITERKKSEEERKKLQEQFNQAQKMDSIGRLAGGIAHDFNNILTSILGYAEIMRLKYKDPSTREGKACEVIVRGARSAADLTRQLLGFARKGKYDPRPTDLNVVIKDTLVMSEKIFEKNIKVKCNFDKKLNIVNADKVQMEQVFTNIFINAKDAMHEGGELTITTRNEMLDENSGRDFTNFTPGHFVEVSISDTGTGMSEDIKNHIFEPFYTTKDEGKGTGLGLATVYGIICNHNGYIKVDSELNKGTTFVIYLPVSEKELIRLQYITELIKGEATILVVDDEENIRETLKEQLELLGYNVLTAINGIEAIKIHRKLKGEIDLVLLDMIMPDMAGRETFKELIKLDHKIKVLLMSGYSQEDKASKTLAEGAVGFIQKPFELSKFSGIINEILKKK